MMGAGKSTMGRALAAKSGREFLDTDQLLQSRFGRPVSEIFRIYGEAAFRDHETSILKTLQPGATVLATGGGIVIREANWVEMRRLGTTLFLDVDPHKLKQRLQRSKKKRPLLAAEDWEERFELLMIQRRELYEQADFTVQVAEEEADEVSDRLLSVLEAGP